MKVSVFVYLCVSISVFSVYLCIAGAEVLFEDVCAFRVLVPAVVHLRV